MKSCHRWLIGAALTICLVTPQAQRANAEVRYWSSARTFTIQPRVSIIPNTSVYYVRDASNYDLYQFGNSWYLVDQGNWYRSNNWRGPFISVQVGSVPRDVVTIPTSYRRYWTIETTSYPDRYRDDGAYASARTFSRKPRMTTIAGTGVSYGRRISDFDLYRYRGTWFIVDDGAWYRSSSWRGPFLSIRASSVPMPVLRVPFEFRHDWSSPASYQRDRDDRDRYERARYWSSGRTFEISPRMATIPSTNVFYLRDDTADYDLYRYGDSWYLNDGGSWYFANTWRGPFVSIRVSVVPHEVLTIPYGYRRGWSGRGSD